MKKEMTEAKVAYQIYPGTVMPPAKDSGYKHDPEDWYFSPKGYHSPAPFSPGFPDKEAAAAAAYEWAMRFEWYV